MPNPPRNIKGLLTTIPWGHRDTLRFSWFITTHQFPPRTALPSTVSAIDPPPRQIAWKPPLPKMSFCNIQAIYGTNIDTGKEDFQKKESHLPIPSNSHFLVIQWYSHCNCCLFYFFLKFPGDWHFLLAWRWNHIRCLCLMPAFVQIWHRLVFCKRRCPLSNTTCILRSHGMGTSCIFGDRTCTLEVPMQSKQIKTILY